MRLLVVILGMLTLALGVGSRFWPTVEQAFVNGNRHHSRELVLWLANIEVGDPLLWINRWSLAALEADPWIARASVVRHFPDTVSISVTERTPRLTNGTVVWGEGGVELPGVAQDVIDSLPVAVGWGEPRISEVLELLDLLSGLEPEVISYTPDGFDITFDGVSVYTPSVTALEAQWAAVEGRLGNRLAVYPWGVSEKNE